MWENPLSLPLHFLGGVSSLVTGPFENKKKKLFGLIILQLFKLWKYIGLLNSYIVEDQVD